MDILLQFALLVLGFVMLIKGADWFVEGASKIADRFGIPQLVIGLTIVALGTSLPEAAISIAAAVQGSAGITIGNVLGSNIMNVLVILGITAVIKTIAVQKSTVMYEIPFVIICTVAMGVMGLMDNTLGRIEGVVLWVLMIIYLIYLLKMAKSGSGDVEEGAKAEANESILKMVALVVIGAAIIVVGSDVTVDAATKIAQAFGMSDRFIGLTIVAFGTSLPELVTSITAAIKGKADIAIGNIVGSNIFNILFVAGTTAIITPVAYVDGFTVDTYVAAAAAVLLLLCVCWKKKLNRLGGLIMLIAYGGYFAYLIR